MKLEEDDGDYDATEIWVNRHPEQEYQQKEEGHDEQKLQQVLLLFGIDI
jgi:hypothetical protein